MAGDEALFMTSLVLIMAIFMRHQSLQTQDDVSLSKTTILVRTASCKPLPISSMAGALQGKQGYI